MRVLNLLPDILAEGQIYRFLGIYSKNREEWTISELASVCQSGTTIAIYDTLGPQAA
jgi:long-subunit acyl-CoA synthetase (AMP-forming)